MTRTLVILCAVTALTGCTTYTVSNGVVYITTDKSIMDHASSTLVKADCDAVRVMREGTWYCETRDVSTTYNRNRF